MTQVVINDSGLKAVVRTVMNGFSTNFLTRFTRIDSNFTECYANTATNAANIATNAVNIKSFGSPFGSI
jgi:hypothetical protein